MPYNANYGTWAFSKLIKMGLLSRYNVGGYSVPCSGVAARVNRMGIVRTMIDELRYWLARRCARHYAKPYLESVRKQGLQWTLELIDEDIELYGDPVVHQLAKVGCVDYAGNR